MSLRIRIAFASMVATLIVVTILSFTLLSLYERSERSALDKTLEAASIEFLRGGQGNPDVLVQRYFNPRIQRNIIRRDLALKIRIIANNNIAFETYDFPNILVSENIGFSTVNINDENWRILTRRDRVGNNSNLSLQIAVSTSGINSQVRDLQQLILLLGVLAVFSAGIAAWGIGSVAMRPLFNLRKDAEQVTETADLSVRVPTSQGAKEIDQLANSLNTMLERIEDGANETHSALETSRDFASNIVHELRTPLTSLKMNLDILQNNLDISFDEKKQILNELQLEHQQLVNLLEGLRLLTRGNLATTDLFQEIDLNELIEEIIARYANSSWPTHPRFESSASFPLVNIWPEGIKILIDNLLRNALIHAKPPLQKSLEVIIAITYNKESWVIHIQDNGEGIPFEDRERIFERFERGKTSDPLGAGLGLALVAQQVKIHDGIIDVQDAIGHGTLITVKFPFQRKKN
tara:strand:+ start:3489 stop:4880 length:1392 start_codon:yes stop_codon:yes gene_type:complete